MLVRFARKRRSSHPHPYPHPRWLENPTHDSLYKSGALRRLEVNKPTEMVGFLCKGYLNYFHENGKLLKCQLAEDKVGEKTSHKAGDLLCWDSAGTPAADCKRLGREMLE